MAGIGFELKRLFRKKGVLASFRAYGYVGIICTGPMLLGAMMLLGVTWLSKWGGASRTDRELLICMITYTLLASLTVSSFFSMAVTRFIADMLYQEDMDRIMPSFWGSSSLMVFVGGILYGLFLFFSGASLFNSLLCLGLFGELMIVWNATSYLTAIKDYRGIMLSFLAAVIVTFVLGYVSLRLGFPVSESMLSSVAIGYGTMMIWDVILLHRYFPIGKGSAFLFLYWMDEFFSLACTGLLMNLGLYLHLLIMWKGPIGQRIDGLFYSAPYYDIPALFAFLTALITTINFVVSVEVNFYPKYRTYYSLFNDKGSIRDIMQAEREMLRVLQSELKYTALKQLITTAIAISLGGFVINLLPLGFNDLMFGYFRILCVGYGMYATGNVVMLILLYFTDYAGALISAAIFAVVSALATLFSLFGETDLYGFGFLAGAAAFFLAALIRLNAFTRRLPYHILSTQPIVMQDKSGFFSRLGKQLNRMDR